MTGDNVSAKWREKKMEGEEGLRTMECLRGRLLAERVASRVAKEETEQMGKKLTELENQLKKEIKSRNRAEKRLKFLLQKLESLNISYLSDESSDNSSFITAKSEISSVSTGSSYSKKQTQNYQKTPTTNFTKCGIEEPIKKIDSQASTSSSGESHNCPSQEGNLGTSEEGSSGNSYGSQCSQDEENLKSDDHRLKSSIGNEEDDKIGGNEHDEDELVHNSLALVVIDPPVKEKEQEQATNPNTICNGSVKDVLDALRYAKEHIQSSIQRCPKIRVGSR